MAQTNGHVSVLPAETLDCLVPRERRSLPLRIIDGTVGLGGHSRRILEACPRAEILGIDRDESALAVSRERLAFAKDRVHLFHGDTLWSARPVPSGYEQQNNHGGQDTGR